MNWERDDQVIDRMRRAEKEFLFPAQKSRDHIVLDHVAVEHVLPHRDPFLFVDEVMMLDLERSMIKTRYALSRAGRVLAGHFPGHPLWPGVLQVEAITQAGLILCLKRLEAPGVPIPILTHVLGARFVRPITPGGDVEIVAIGVEDGLFSVIIGQCLHFGEICSVASVKVSF